MRRAGSAAGRGGERDVMLGDEGAGEGTMLLRRRSPARRVHKQRGEGEEDKKRGGRQPQTTTDNGANRAREEGRRQGNNGTRCVWSDSPIRDSDLIRGKKGTNEQLAPRECNRRTAPQPNRNSSRNQCETCTVVAVKLSERQARQVATP